MTLQNRENLFEFGSRHPISITRNEILSIFTKLGYAIADGPEIEDDWHVFGALNFPPRASRKRYAGYILCYNREQSYFTPYPYKFCSSAYNGEGAASDKGGLSGRRVFRNEAISARAHCIFHQVEGLYIDKNVSFADLKQAVLLFAREMFGETAQIRLRPSYFPFTSRVPRLM